jgi:hypothetical protein
VCASEQCVVHLLGRVVAVGIIIAPPCAKRDTITPVPPNEVKSQPASSSQGGQSGSATALGVKARAIRLKDTRSRWCGCAPDGTLAFSRRLVLAPDWVMDYVVPHEVAHLRGLNHSARFWAHLDRLTPHRDAAVEWLRLEGPTLLRIGCAGGVPVRGAGELAGRL